MAEIALVEIEEIGTSSIGLEQGDGIAPMVAPGASRREGVERREGSEVERGDRRGPCAPCEIADELRPVGRFKRRAFARGHHPGIGKRRPCD
jgi:hypothetical protein